MGLRFIRQPSDTPNVSNADDARMVRYAYGGQNGYVQAAGNELNHTVDGRVFRINSGVVVLQGWESEIDGNGWTMTVDNVATKRFYSVYYEVNLATQTTSIKSIYDTAGYPEIGSGDDLTAVQTGTARLLLYHFAVLNGVISEVKKLVQKVDYKKDSIEQIKSSLENGDIVPAEAKNSEKINGLELITVNGVLKIGDFVIPQRKVIFENSPYQFRLGYVGSGAVGSLEFHLSDLDDKFKIGSHYELELSINSRTYIVKLVPCKSDNSSYPIAYAGSVVQVKSTLDISIMTLFLNKWGQDTLHISVQVRENVSEALQCILISLTEIIE